jgi:hypothetical protein
MRTCWHGSREVHILTPMHLQIPHEFDQQQAIEHVKQRLDGARAQIAAQVKIEKEEWDENKLSFAFTVQKQHITGMLTVEDEEFVIDAKLPLLLRMFEGKISKMVGDRLKSLL